MNLNASTGQLERLFSEWAYVHSPKRNRLNSERSAKLVSLYYNMRLKDDVYLEYIDHENEELIDE